jgi:glutamate-5-semialdehyde dehydrogenase
MTLEEQMTSIAQGAKTASRTLTKLSTEEKNQCLRAMADAVDANQAGIQEENQKDLINGREMGLSSALLDRLELTDKRIAGMSQGLREVADLPDPVGRLLDERFRPNGIKLQKVSTPIGVVVIIYESRPNVTADAAGLCLKSGNATILRGGKEAIHSNQIIAKIMVKAALEICPAFSLDAIQVIPTTDRKAIPILLSLSQYIDLCMPRGGEGLIRAVAECSRVPVIKHYKGVCHVYVDRDANLDQAAAIAFNAKTHRPGVCNAIETLLIDREVSSEFAPQISKLLWEKGVEIRADDSFIHAINETNRPDGAKLENATEADWEEEYLDLILAVKIVDGIDDAIEHINEHGSGHSDTIVTTQEESAQKFMNEVDSSTVYWNASTRFTDGAEFGMGAEIGISTDKIGARGPMGLEELTSYKWLGFGQGQIRQ